MSKTEQSPGQKFGIKIGEAIDAILGVKPSAVKALSLQVEGGSAIEVGAEDPNNLVGASATDATGAPLADGEYKLADGRVMKVQGGKVADVAAPAAAAAPAAGAAAPAAVTAPAAQPDATALALKAANDKIAALEQKLASSVTAAAVDEKVAAAITELKNTITAGGGRGPAAAINNNGGNAAVSLSPVQAKMQELQKKQSIIV